MAEASIPVDLLNPGQVFACLGFLEAADASLGDAEGGFDWSDPADVRFCLHATGDENPFAVVLKCLSESKVRRFAPIGYKDPPGKKSKKSRRTEESADPTTLGDLSLSESFPNRVSDRMTLPIRLDSDEQVPIELGHWADGTRRNAFKLYSGNRSAHSIACSMLQGVAKLWQQQPIALTARPFDVLTPMGGSFNFDPRGGWTALDAGYSPNEHSDHEIEASPVVEILAAWGLEHARPDEYEKRQVRYAAWNGAVPPMMARALLGGGDVAVTTRRFRFVLVLSGKNKVVTFAQEETTA